MLQNQPTNTNSASERICRMPIQKLAQNEAHREPALSLGLPQKHSTEKPARMVPAPYVKTLD